MKVFDSSVQQSKTSLFIPASGGETGPEEPFGVDHNLQTRKVHLVLPSSRETQEHQQTYGLSAFGVKENPKTGLTPAACLSNAAVMQQRLHVLVAGCGGALLVAAREGGVDVNAGQRGHGLLALRVRLVTKTEIGRRQGGGRLFRDEERHDEGDDHRARPQQEGRPGDQRSLGSGQTDGRSLETYTHFHIT